jgi:cytochrome c
MKKNILLIASVCVAVSSFLACGTKKDEAKSDDAYELAEPEGPSADDLIAEGKTLVAASDCKTCHHETNKLVGPAHLDVAKKYDFTTANVTMLAGKIINGGSGNWGDIMMVPHANISQSDAEKMARYVLSMDGEKEH